MSIKINGKDAFDKFLSALPGKLEQNVLRGGMRAMAKVIADDAQERCISSEAAASIKVGTRAERGLVTSKVQTKGRGAYLAPWLEYGTAPHFISVDESQRGGRSVRRINELHRKGSLVINGQFVGETVHHPGARPHPFLRPAVDSKMDEGLAAMTSYVTTRLARADLDSAPPREPDE